MSIPVKDSRTIDLEAIILKLLRFLRKRLKSFVTFIFVTVHDKYSFRGGRLLYFVFEHKTILQFTKEVLYL